MTKEEAIAKAKFLICMYPNNKDAKNLVDEALAKGIINSESDALAVWGRLNRELRINVNN